MFFCASFSAEIKKQIKNKAKHRSELSRENSRPLVCAHLRHKGGREPSPYTERRSMGRLVTDIEHLVHHELFRGKERVIGLTEKQNEWTIAKLRERVLDYDNENNIYYKNTEQKYRDAQLRWIELYDSNPKGLGLSTKVRNELVQFLVSNAEKRNREEVEPEEEITQDRASYL